jgi:hypothetical protein
MWRALAICVNLAWLWFLYIYGVPETVLVAIGVGFVMLTVSNWRSLGQAAVRARFGEAARARAASLLGKGNSPKDE